MISNLISRLYRNFLADSLFRNSVYLMVSTVIMAILGFFFWLLCARLYTPEQIGIGTALISAMSLISYLSLLGFNSTFVRFLPKSEQRNEKINTGLILVLITAAFGATGYVLGLPVFAPGLDFVRQNPMYAFGFVVLVALAAINLLTDSVFIAYRAAKYNLLINTVMSAVKLLSPLAVVGLGAYGIFLASGAAAFVALVLSIYFMMRSFSYVPKLVISRSIIKQVLSFSSASYVANLLNILPTLTLPIIIIGKLGAAQAGYFYLAFMVANLLYTVAYSVSQSLFAEGSHFEHELAALVKRSVLILAAIILPSSLVLAVAGKWLLFIFGKNYSGAASVTLTILSLAAPAVAVYVVAVVLLRVSKQIYSLIFMNLLFAISTIGLTMLWAHRGLAWVATAWLLGHLIAGLAGLAWFYGQRSMHKAPAGS